MNIGAMGTNAAAQYLGLSTHFLKRARITGKGPAFIKVGRKVLYIKSDLDNFLISKGKRINTCKENYEGGQE